MSKTTDPCEVVEEHQPTDYKIEYATEYVGQHTGQDEFEVGPHLLRRDTIFTHT